MQTITSAQDNTSNIQKKRVRSSNLELYRIVAMFLIVAHHYVYNSKLVDILNESIFNLSSVSMIIFGAFGKTGINCFILITGFFMCKSKISLKKLLKLYLQITFYSVLIYVILNIGLYHTFSPTELFSKFIPVKSLTTNDFVSCFLIFYLLIPFLNILIQNLDQRLHKLLLVLQIGAYTILPSIPGFSHVPDYLSWFSTIYLLASYINKYGLFNQLTHKQWGLITILFIFIAILSIVALTWAFKSHLTSYNLPLFFVSDSNKIFALGIAVSSFMWFKELKIPHSPLINTIGASTFGILLIHANCETMRTFLWKETFSNHSHFSADALYNIGYALIVVSIVFIGCSILKILRSKYLENPIINTTTKILSNIGALKFLK